LKKTIENLKKIIQDKDEIIKKRDQEIIELKQIIKEKGTSNSTENSKQIEQKGIEELSFEQRARLKLLSDRVTKLEDGQKVQPKDGLVSISEPVVQKKPECIRFTKISTRKSSKPSKKNFKNSLKD